VDEIERPEEHDDDEIFPSIAYEAAPPPRRDFMPWHRPRKQYVRRKQWLHQARKLIKSLPHEGPIRYLGLPGDDLLDLRALHEIADSSRELLFLGFMDGGGQDARVNLNISMQEVLDLKHVSERSHVVPDNINSLARSTSMGTDYLRKFGPFDVVNLGFCNNVMTGAIGERSIYDAINNLFGLQARRLDPWLLFLTTRAVQETVHPDVSEKLDLLLAENLEQCKGFSEGLGALLGEVADIPTTLSDCDAVQWFDMFCVCMAKVILNAAVSGRMKVELKSTMSYRVGRLDDAEPDDLVSFAFLITPSIAPAGDAGGLSAAQPGPDECELAVKLAPRIAKRVQVDKLLDEDKELLASMIDESAALLKQARYPEAEYRAWVVQT